MISTGRGNLSFIFWIYLEHVCETWSFLQRLVLTLNQFIFLSISLILLLYVLISLLFSNNFDFISIFHLWFNSLLWVDRRLSLSYNYFKLFTILRCFFLLFFIFFTTNMHHLYKLCVFSRFIAKLRWLFFFFNLLNFNFAFCHVLLGQINWAWINLLPIFFDE